MVYTSHTPQTQVNPAIQLKNHHRHTVKAGALPTGRTPASGLIGTLIEKPSA